MARSLSIRWIGVGALVACLLLALVLIDQTWAQSPTPTTTAQTPGATPPAQPEDNPRQRPGERGGRGERRGRHHHAGMYMVQATADVTGLTAEQVREALHDGKTFAAIAQEHGKTADAIVNAAVAQIKTELDARVADGKLTQADADELLVRARERASALVDQSAPPRGGPGGGPRHHGPGSEGPGSRGALIQATAEVTGLTAAEVRAELADGKTLAQVAQARGKSADAIIANLRTKGQERLDKLLERAREALDKTWEQ